MTIKIFLGNLSSDTSSDHLRPLFEKYGEVVECDVLKNFGFVHMTNKGDAQKAIAQLDGYNVDGKNIRVELSTGKGRTGGPGGKFDRRGGFGGGGRPRPYPPGRDRDFDYYPPPPPPPFYDRIDPYYRYYMERERERDAMYRGAIPERDRYAPPMPPRDRYPEMRDRLPPPRSYMDDRARGPLPPDPYYRDAAATRPPPEYYERKGPMSASRGLESVGAAGAAAGRGGSQSAYNGVGGAGDYYRRPPGASSLGGGAAGGAGGAGAGDYYQRQNGQQSGYGRGGSMTGSAETSQNFAQDPIFF